MSDISKTTVGGVEYEDLLRGAKSYACNPANLTSETEVKSIKKKLITQLEQTVQEIERESDRKIANIYIGKTFIRQRRNPGKGYRAFDPIKHDSWKKNGIGSRWCDHRKKGRDGLVVLGAITRETMPERCRDRIHQEYFALAMEQKLLHHYLLSHPDPRVVNDTFSTGQVTKDKAYAYAVYMAFQYGEVSSTMCQYTEPGPSRTSQPLFTKESSSLECTKPTIQPLTEQALAHFNEQQPPEREDDIQQASSEVNQEIEPDTCITTQPTTFPLTARSYRGRNRQTRSYQMSDTTPSRRSSRHRVRFEQDSPSNVLLQRYRFTG